MNKSNRPSTLELEDNSLCLDDGLVAEEPDIDEIVGFMSDAAILRLINTPEYKLLGPDVLRGYSRGYKLSLQT